MIVREYVEKRQWKNISSSKVRRLEAVRKLFEACILCGHLRPLQSVARCCENGPYKTRGLSSIDSRRS